MRRVKRNLVLTKKEADKINRLLDNEPVSKDDSSKETDAISYSATFFDGVRMEIAIKGVNYIEGASNTPYIEAILYRGNEELARTDHGDDASNVFFGEWHLEYGGYEYIVDICYSANPEEESVFIPRQIKLKKEVIYRLPPDIRLYVKKGEPLYLVEKPKNHRAFISISDDPMNEICTCVSTYDIDMGLREEEK